MPAIQSLELLHDLEFDSYMRPSPFRLGPRMHTFVSVLFISAVQRHIRTRWEMILLRPDMRGRPRPRYSDQRRLVGCFELMFTYYFMFTALSYTDAKWYQRHLSTSFTVFVWPAWWLFWDWADKILREHLEREKCRKEHEAFRKEAAERRAERERRRAQGVDALTHYAIKTPIGATRGDPAWVERQSLVEDLRRLLDDGFFDESQRGAILKSLECIEKEPPTFAASKDNLSPRVDSSKPASQDDTTKPSDEPIGKLDKRRLPDVSKVHATMSPCHMDRGHQVDNELDSETDDDATCYDYSPDDGNHATEGFYDDDDILTAATAGSDARMPEPADYMPHSVETYEEYGNDPSGYDHADAYDNTDGYDNADGYYDDLLDGLDLSDNESWGEFEPTILTPILETSEEHEDELGTTCTTANSTSWSSNFDTATWATGSFKATPLPHKTNPSITVTNTAGTTMGATFPMQHSMRPSLRVVI